MNQIIPKNFDFLDVMGMTTSQLYQHYVLYTKYIDSLNKVSSDLQSESIYKNCNANYSQIRCASKASTYCLDSIRLHELYFENITGKNTKINGNIEKIIIDCFGSYGSFMDKFKCIGMSMRGWVVFCHDKYTDDYYIYGQDSHDDGVILCAQPLIVLDVYEHAYMIDFGIDRSLYIDVFFENLDFSIINKRLG